LLLLLSVMLFVPPVRFYFYQIFENNLLLFVSIFAVVFGQKFSVWAQPEDRACLTRENLASYNLI
jgi:hypothetical protein